VSVSLGDGEPAAGDLMISRQLLENLRGEAYALVDLFTVYGRRRFRPELGGLAHLGTWQGRGARQRLARTIAMLHGAGYLRQLADGRYRVVSRALMTGAEYRSAYPGATYRNGLSWPPNGHGAR
jgi:hypothetical protein